MKECKQSWTILASKVPSDEASTMSLTKYSRRQESQLGKHAGNTEWKKVSKLIVSKQTTQNASKQSKNFQQCLQLNKQEKQANNKEESKKEIEEIRKDIAGNFVATKAWRWASE